MVYRSAGEVAGVTLVAAPAPAFHGLHPEVPVTASPRPTPDTTTAGVPLSDLEADATRFVVLGLGNRIQGDEALGALFVMDQLPARIRVIGLQPERIGLGVELSDSLAPHFGELIAAVTGHLRAWQEADAVAG